MRRRTYLATAGAVGVAGLAGCGLVSSHRSLANPTVQTSDVGDHEIEKALQFTSGGADIANPGVSASYADLPVTLYMEVPHREQTDVTKLRYHFKHQDTEHGRAPRIAFEAPFPGGTPQIDVSLYHPPQERGTVVEAQDLGDLKDATITTYFWYQPRDGRLRPLDIAVTLQLEDEGFFGDSYTLEGTIPLDFPDPSD